MTEREKEHARLDLGDAVLRALEAGMTKREITAEVEDQLENAEVVL